MSSHTYSHLVIYLSFEYVREEDIFYVYIRVNHRIRYRVDLDKGHTLILRRDYRSNHILYTLNIYSQIIVQYIMKYRTNSL